MKLDLTVIIAARNEELMMRECLKTVLGWAEEVLVVDIQSLDKTPLLAKKLGAKVIESKWNGYDYSKPRILGLKNAKCKWVLYVDADERIPRELKNEIGELLKGAKEQKFAYAIPRRNIVLGKELKHCGQWPDCVKRLFMKGRFSGWTGKVHEEPHFEGELGILKNPMVHVKHETIAEMVDKTNDWSEIEARLMFEAGHPSMNVPRFVSAIAREFWLRMIRQAAFLDGSVGIIYAIYQVFSRFVSYSKLWEMQIKSG